MIIIDSSLWIEFFMGSKYGAIIKENNSFQESNYYVPTIIVREVHKKLTDLFNEELATEYCYYFQNGKIIDLNFNLSLLSSKLSKTHNLPLADSIIYATTVNFNAILFTIDKHFEGLPNVQYLQK